MLADRSGMFRLAGRSPVCIINLVVHASPFLLRPAHASLPCAVVIVVLSSSQSLLTVSWG
jgi:hypothetical protein